LDKVPMTLCTNIFQNLNVYNREKSIAPFYDNDAVGGD